MWPFRYKHQHHHEPVARYDWPPEQAPGIATAMGVGVTPGRTGPRQVVTWRCWCSDVRTEVMDGRPTLAELIGLGAEAQQVRRLRDQLRNGGGLDPAQDFYLREQDIQPDPAPRGVAGDLQAFNAAVNLPGRIGEVVSTVQVPDWPDTGPVPPGGGGTVPHLPVQQATSATGWVCAACELPIQQLDDEDAWETMGSHTVACDVTSGAPWLRSHP